MSIDLNEFDKMEYSWVWQTDAMNKTKEHIKSNSKELEGFNDVLGKIVFNCFVFIILNFDNIHKWEIIHSLFCFISNLSERESSFF